MCLHANMRQNIIKMLSNLKQKPSSSHSSQIFQIQLCLQKQMWSDSYQPVRDHNTPSPNFYQSLASLTLSSTFLVTPQILPGPHLFIVFAISTSNTFLRSQFYSFLTYIEDTISPMMAWPMWITYTEKTSMHLPKDKKYRHILLSISH